MRSRLRKLYDRRAGEQKFLNRKNRNRKIINELRSAWALLEKKTKKDKQLALLVVINPVLAFQDAGIELSPQAQHHLKNISPWWQRDNLALYRATETDMFYYRWVVYEKPVIPEIEFEGEWRRDMYPGMRVPRDPATQENLFDYREVVSGSLNYSIDLILVPHNLYCHADYPPHMETTITWITGGSVPLRLFFGNTDHTTVAPAGIGNIARGIAWTPWSWDPVRERWNARLNINTEILDDSFFMDGDFHFFLDVNVVDLFDGTANVRREFTGSVLETTPRRGSPPELRGDYEYRDDQGIDEAISAIAKLFVRVPGMSEYLSELNKKLQRQILK